MDRAFRLYRSHFTLYLLTAAVFLVPFSLLSGLLSGRFITGYTDALGALVASPDAVNTGVFAETLGAMGNFFGGMVILGSLGLVLNGIVTLALTGQSIANLHEERLSIGGSVRRGLTRFWPYMGLMIVQFVLVFFATLATLIPLFILMGVLAFVGTAVGSTVFNNVDGIVGGIALVLLILCGYSLLIFVAVAPALYFSARWFVAVPTLIAEGLGPLDALRRSWRLTHGQVRRTVGYVILVFVITAIVVSLPVSLLQQIIIFVLPSAGFGLATGITSAISSIFTVVWTPFYACAVVLLYYDLRVRSESYDLDLRIQQLESQIMPGDVPAHEQTDVDRPF